MMDRKEMFAKCAEFFDGLCKMLSNYEVVGSCNADSSVYLIPKGTVDELSYYGKPVLSFRISDHWNWYSNIRKCSDPKMIQCFSVDMPWARKRNYADGPSKPVYGCQVAIYGSDHRYHHVYGERFDRKSGKWYWETTTVDDVVQKWFPETILEGP